MKKLLSLALVMMLVLTSIFTGFVVSAEDVVVDNTITETSWEEDYGIKVDESIYPGFYLGNNYQIWDTDNPNYSTARTPEEGVKYFRIDSRTGKEYTYRDTNNHRKYAPSVAINAGRTGGVGDNALVFGMPVSLSNAYLLFNNRTQDADRADIVCGNGTWNISFDIRLVSGEVSNIYSNFVVNSPTLETYADCVEDKSTAINVNGTTDGYSGTDISANKWTTLKYTATVTDQNNYFFINIQAPSENGAIVLIDNLKICNEKGTNYLTSDRFTPIGQKQNPESPASPYYDEWANGTLYIGNEFGNFNSSTFVNKTLWHNYGYAVDESIVPGYYLGNDFDYWTNYTGTKPNISGIMTYYRGGSTYGNNTVRFNYAPSVAIGAGKTGMADDNALIFGLPVDVNQYALAFYVRNNGNTVFTANKYQISFDIKSVAGTCAGIHSTLSTWAPANNATSDSKAEGIAYNNKYNEETGTYGTDGYTQEDISTTDWTTLTFYVDLTASANYFWINLMPADAEGAIVLIDNIVIQKADGENMFVSDNIMIASKSNTLAYDAENDEQKYNLIQYNCGTFDYADAKAVDNTVDENVNYLPVNAIGHYSADAAPTLSEAGEGVNGSYAINVPVNQNGVNRLVFRAYNPVEPDTIHPNDTYLFEFKARVTAGVVDKLDVGIATNDYNPTTGYYHNMQIFHSATRTNDKGETTYPHKGYTQNYLRVDGSDLTSEWQTFKFYATTNCYANVYRHLKFTLYGADSSVVIQLDDIKGYTVADGELTPIYVWAAGDPNGSSFDLAEVSAYDVTVSDTDGYIVTVPNAGVTAAEFIENMNLNANLEFGYRNNKEIYGNDTLIADDEAIGTGYALSIVGTNGNGTYNGVYETFNIAVKNDINGDTEVDARDIVRAKKITAGTETATAVQLAAASATDEIQIEDVVAIRNSFMK